MCIVLKNDDKEGECVEIESLACKMRPRCFAEVIGQQVAVSVLQRQIATKTWKNAYLFCGSHGCGKTTVARIMANDINGGNGSPIEIDAASNNGIASVRELIQDAQQCSLDSEYKVYIIDEAHQLTNMAWDAMLKLIEEPPLNSIFIFCTTAPNKLPMTILSRVQRFDFNKVEPVLISNRLQFILNEYFPNIKYDVSAMDRLAFMSNGHVRDAVSSLDKCLSMSDNITLQTVEDLFGLTSVEKLVELENSLNKKDFNKSISILNEMLSGNISAVEIYSSIYSFTLDCAIYSHTGDIYATTIPHDMAKSIVKSGNYKNMVEIFTRYLGVVTNETAEALLKTIVLEVCS